MLAAWGTWWIRGTPESTIRYVMFRAPMLMAVVFFVMAAVFGEMVNARTQFLAVGVLGAIVSIPLGYFYVFCVVLIREEFGPTLYTSQAVGATEDCARLTCPL